MVETGSDPFNRMQLKKARLGVLLDSLIKISTWLTIYIEWRYIKFSLDFVIYRALLMTCHLLQYVTNEFLSEEFFLK